MRDVDKQPRWRRRPSLGTHADGAQRAAGHVVRCSDLHAMGFAPILAEEHHKLDECDRQRQLAAWAERLRHIEQEPAIEVGPY